MTQNVPRPVKLVTFLESMGESLVLIVRTILLIPSAHITNNIMLPATYSTTYTDDYITLEKGVGAYIGNRSVVIHTPDTKRFACANITAVTPSGSGSDSPTMKPSYWGCGLGAVMGLKFLLV